MIPQIGDVDVFDSIFSDDLWCVDKLILSKKLGYKCGPAGDRLGFILKYE